MKDITYKELANYLDKSEHTIKQWKQKFPILLEFSKTGAFCKKNNITLEDIKACIKMKELAKDPK